VVGDCEATDEAPFQVPLPPCKICRTYTVRILQGGSLYTPLPVRCARIHSEYLTGREPARAAVDVVVPFALHPGGEWPILANPQS
jgi:hypothetical protein